MTNIHGGDWASYETEYGTMPLDFSANISPLGVPDGVYKALRVASADVDRYPDPLCRELTAALAAYENVPEEWILCGNGAADLIYRVLQTLHPHNAVVPAPTFTEYESVLRSLHCNIHYYQADRVPDIPVQTGLVLLCEPNNPTGTRLGTDAINQICVAASKAHAYVLMDETFADFLTPEEREYPKEFLEYNPNLILLKAFTKTYAMAGVRLGYLLCSSGELVEAFRNAGAPWSVSHLAQKAGVAALEDYDYLDRLRTLVETERPYLENGLLELGFRVVRSHANFILFQGPEGLEQKLREKGILIRCCRDFKGLDSTWYRISVRTRADNHKLLSALQEVLA